MKLSELLADKSVEWKDGFFAAVNLNRQTKAVFLGMFIGEPVEVELYEPAGCKPGAANLTCQFPKCGNKADFIIDRKALCSTHRERWKDEGYDQPGLPPSATT